MANEASIELGYAELKQLILSLNFEIVVSVSSLLRLLPCLCCSYTARLFCF